MGRRGTDILNALLATMSSTQDVTFHPQIFECPSPTFFWQGFFALVRVVAFLEKGRLTAYEKKMTTALIRDLLKEARRHEEDAHMLKTAAKQLDAEFERSKKVELENKTLLHEVSDLRRQLYEVGLIHAPLDF